MWQDSLFRTVSAHSDSVVVSLSISVDKGIVFVGINKIKALLPFQLSTVMYCSSSAFWCRQFFSEPDQTKPNQIIHDDWIKSKSNRLWDKPKHVGPKFSVRLGLLRYWTKIALHRINKTKIKAVTDMSIERKTLRIWPLIQTKIHIQIFYTQILQP